MPVDAAQRARCERIRDKARELFARPDVRDCESLAQLVEWTQNEFHDVYFGTYNNDEETFVDDLGLVLTDTSDWVVTGTRSSDLDLYAGYGYAGDSCFNIVFRDGSNQVRHFWGYVWVSFQYGRLAGDLATFREWFPPEPADALLGGMGAKLGAGLDGIGVDLDEVADWIRSNVCVQERCFLTLFDGDEEEEEDEEESDDEDEEDD